MLQTLGAIVLAAGFSRRMGGENKLLKPLAGRPLLAHALGMVASLNFGQVLVVAGDRADEIAPLVAEGASLIRNDHATEGMGGSIACAAASLASSLDGVFIVLGDMPFVERQDYERLADTLVMAGREAICVPVHDGRRGNPVLFGRAHFEGLAKLGGDIGARRLVQTAGAGLREVEGCSSGVIFDLDEPQAFAAAEARLRGDNSSLS